jgi:acyl-coenzyme A synthetase/AMP-(fatty) acid ligase
VDAVAFFYTAADAQAVGDALRERAGALPPHQRPRWWHAVDSLPRGPTGKLLRRTLRELHRTLA